MISIMRRFQRNSRYTVFTVHLLLSIKCSHTSLQKLRAKNQYEFSQLRIFHFAFALAAFGRVLRVVPRAGLCSMSPALIIKGRVRNLFL
jgi:hypothetical protein